MRRVDYENRRSRGGLKLLPPNPNQWENEHNALDLREVLGLPLDVALEHGCVFDILPRVSVHPHGVIPAADVFLEHFRSGRSSAWSGMAITTPDGDELIFYNDAHPLNRIRSTLMEEFFHIWLEHPRSTLRLFSEDGSWRSYDARIEQEAYGSGAAALVPYSPLREMVMTNVPTAKIARHFKVSEDLIVFRTKVTKVYRRRRRS
jgi:IrrE N-terminal-like domain